jgi:hypothetical protein
MEPEGTCSKRRNEPKQWRKINKISQPDRVCDDTENYRVVGLRQSVLVLRVRKLGRATSLRLRGQTMEKNIHKSVAGKRDQ